MAINFPISTIYMYMHSPRPYDFKAIIKGRYNKILRRRKLRHEYPLCQSGVITEGGSRLVSGIVRDKTIQIAMTFLLEL